LQSKPYVLSAFPTPTIKMMQTDDFFAKNFTNTTVWGSFLPYFRDKFDLNLAVTIAEFFSRSITLVGVIVYFKKYLKRKFHNIENLGLVRNVSEVYHVNYVTLLKLCERNCTQN
jgi:hypothetical protein